MINDTITLKTRPTSYKKNTANAFGGAGFSERYDPNFDKNTLKSPYEVTLETTYNAANQLFYDVRGTYSVFFRLFNPDPQTIFYRIYTLETDYDDITQVPDTDWHEDVGSERTVPTNTWDVDPFENVRVSSRITAIRVELRAAAQQLSDIQGAVSAT